ncbi:hypothetical protein TNCV_4524131 [Trichonephila clavipes]|nr:hypothetical protein TNCV_4524131 [Trichonephila clavipes]
MPEKFAVSNDFYFQRHKGTKQMAHIVKPCPKQIPKVNLVPKPNHNTALVGFTRLNNQGVGEGIHRLGINTPLINLQYLTPPTM